MAKKQLAKAVLDRIKRSAKDGYPKGKKGSKPVKKGEKSYKKKAVNFDKFKQPASGQISSAKKFAKGAAKKSFKTAIPAGIGFSAGVGVGAFGEKKEAKKRTTKKAADDLYKKQKEKQKKYREKKSK